MQIIQFDHTGRWRRGYRNSFIVRVAVPSILYFVRLVKLYILRLYYVFSMQYDFN